MSADPPVVSAEAIVHRARLMWMELAGVPVEFPPPGSVNVVVSETSRLMSPGWTSIVVLEGAGIATVPTATDVELVGRALRELPFEALTDLNQMRSVLPAFGFTRPLSLSYLDAEDFHPAHGGVPIEELPATHNGVKTLLSGVTSTDLTLSGMHQLDSTVFVTREDDTVTAAAGYSVWPLGVAHLLVLTSPDHRRRGLGRAVASAATEQALSTGLSPQWRAQPEASRRIAASLGFRQYGHQISFLLRPPPDWLGSRGYTSRV